MEETSRQQKQEEFRDFPHVNPVFALTSRGSGLDFPSQEPRPSTRPGTGTGHHLHPH
jgi:hypothetical protein